MTLDELREALDGLFAYDTGSVDSGTHDESLRRRCIEALNALPRDEFSLFSPDLSRIVRDLWLTEDAIQQGYGVEDALSFMAWLAERMEQPDV